MCSPRGWKISRSVNKLRGEGRKRKTADIQKEGKIKGWSHRAGGGQI